MWCSLCPAAGPMWGWGWRVEGQKINWGFCLSHALFPLSPPRTPGLFPVWWETCQVEVPWSPSCWTWVGSSASKSSSDSWRGERAPWPSCPGFTLYLRAKAQAGHYTMSLFIQTKRTQPTKGGRGSPLAFHLIHSKSGLLQSCTVVFKATWFPAHLYFVLVTQICVCVPV